MSIEHVISGAARWAVVHGDCLDVLPTIGRVDVCLTDPPYSESVHRSVRSSGRGRLPDAEVSACRTRRVVDLGFGHLRARVRRSVASWCAANVARWSAMFSDVESCHLWRLSGEASGMRYVRTAQWLRIDGAPQFSGDRPASSFEAITLLHAADGRFRWNGGGLPGVYEHPVVQNRSGHRYDRVHSAQKPEGLMLDLVRDFSDPDELVIDMFCGSGTTGVACLKTGRRFVGIERDAKHVEVARERLEAAAAGVSVAARRAKQTSLFGGGVR